MAISTNQKPTIYRNLYENMAPGIADAIPSFNWRKMYVYMKNSHIPNLIILTSIIIYLKLYLYKIIYLNIYHKLFYQFNRAQQHTG